MLSVVKGPYVSPEMAEEDRLRAHAATALNTEDRIGAAATVVDGAVTGSATGAPGARAPRAIDIAGAGATGVTYSHPLVSEQHASAPPDPLRPAHGRPMVSPDMRDRSLSHLFDLQQASLRRIAAAGSLLRESAPSLGSASFGLNQFKITCGIDNHNVPYDWLKLIKTEHLDTEICVRGVAVQEKGSDRRHNELLHNHLLTEARAPPGKLGCDMLKEHLKSFLKLPEGITRGIRIQVKMLDCVSQSFKCWAGYAQKQKGDVRGHYAIASKGVDAEWLEGAIRLRKAHALSTLEGRIPLGRRNTVSEMFRFARSHMNDLPFQPTMRQLLFWAISSGSHVPEKWSTPSAGRGYNRAMVETELKCIMHPETITMDDIDLLFFNTGWKTRYHDDHEVMTADQGILGGGSRPDPTKHFRSFTYKEAVDLSNGIRSGRLAEASTIAPIFWGIR